MNLALGGEKWRWNAADDEHLKLPPGPAYMLSGLAIRAGWPMAGAGSIPSRIHGWLLCEELGIPNRLDNRQYFNIFPGAPSDRSGLSRLVGKCPVPQFVPMTGSR